MLVHDATTIGSLLLISFLSLRSEASFPLIFVIIEIENQLYESQINIIVAAFQRALDFQFPNCNYTNFLFFVGEVLLLYHSHTTLYTVIHA